MSLVSLSEAKSHLKVDITDDDALIQTYINASVHYIGTYLNNPSYSFNPAIKQACLLIIGDFYQNRQGASVNEVKANPAVVNLLYPFRKDIGI